MAKAPVVQTFHICSYDDMIPATIVDMVDGAHAAAAVKAWAKKNPKKEALAALEPMGEGRYYVYAQKPKYADGLFSGFDVPEVLDNSAAWKANEVRLVEQDKLSTLARQLGGLWSAYEAFKANPKQSPAELLIIEKSETNATAIYRDGMHLLTLEAGKRLTRDSVMQALLAEIAAHAPEAHGLIEAGLRETLVLPEGHELASNLGSDAHWVTTNGHKDMSFHVRPTVRDENNGLQIRAEFRAFLDEPRSFTFLSAGRPYFDQKIELLNDDESSLRATGYRELGRQLGRVFTEATQRFQPTMSLGEPVWQDRQPGQLPADVVPVLMTHDAPYTTKTYNTGHVVKCDDVERASAVLAQEGRSALLAHPDLFRPCHTALQIGLTSRRAVVEVDRSALVGSDMGEGFELGAMLRKAAEICAQHFDDGDPKAVLRDSNGVEVGRLSTETGSLSPTRQAGAVGVYVQLSLRGGYDAREPLIQAAIQAEAGHDMDGLLLTNSGGVAGMTVSNRPAVELQLDVQSGVELRSDSRRVLGAAPESYQDINADALSHLRQGYLERIYNTYAGDKKVPFDRDDFEQLTVLATWLDGELHEKGGIRCAVGLESWGDAVEQFRKTGEGPVMLSMKQSLATTSLMHRVIDRVEQQLEREQAYGDGPSF